MDNLQISNGLGFLNDAPATSGSVVVGASEKGSIQLPWGIYSLIFSSDGSPMNVMINHDLKTILFNGTDNPLGSAVGLKIPMSDLTVYVLNLAIYTIGEGVNAARIVHFSFYSTKEF